MRYVNLEQNIDRIIFLFQNIQIHQLFRLFRTWILYEALLINKNIFAHFGKFG